MTHAEDLVRTNIDNWFVYHAPVGAQAARYGKMREYCRVLAHFIVDYTPVSREQSTALSRLRDVMMWANAAIACNPAEPIMQEPGETPPPTEPAPSDESDTTGTGHTDPTPDVPGPPDQPIPPETAPDEPANQD